MPNVTLQGVPKVLPRLAGELLAASLWGPSTARPLHAVEENTTTLLQQGAGIIHHHFFNDKVLIVLSLSHTHFPSKDQKDSKYPLCHTA